MTDEEQLTAADRIVLTAVSRHAVECYSYELEQVRRWEAAGIVTNVREYDYGQGKFFAGILTNAGRALVGEIKDQFERARAESSLIEYERNHYDGEFFRVWRGESAWLATLVGADDCQSKDEAVAAGHAAIAKVRRAALLEAAALAAAWADQADWTAAALALIDFSQHLLAMADGETERKETSDDHEPK